VSEPRNDGGPAFPRTLLQNQWTVLGTQEVGVAGYDAGMSLRDYFAAKAMPTVMTASDIQEVLAWANWCDKVATTCYELADAMIRARESE
jgi:hypothetical protein